MSSDFKNRPALAAENQTVLRLRLKQSLLFLVCLTLSLNSSAYAKDSLAASTSKKARKEAITKLPWDKFTKEQTQVIRHVVNKASMYRRLPTRVIECNADLFTHLSQRPEIILDIWKTLGISHLKLSEVGPRTYQINDGQGTTGKFKFIEETWSPRAQNRAVIYAEGSFQGGPFKKPIKVRCVLLLQSGSAIETNGRTYVTARVDAFILVEHFGLDLLVKTVHPWVGSVADSNFTETMKFFQQFSRSAETRPKAVARLASELQSISEKKRLHLAKVCATTVDEYNIWKQKRQARLKTEGARYTETKASLRKPIPHAEPVLTTALQVSPVRLNRSQPPPRKTTSYSRSYR